MKVAPENIFPGARIKLGTETYSVIKVNAKSFYASTISYSDFIERYNLRTKGVTFTAFCKQNNINSYKYTENFEIEEAEFNRKELAEQNNNSSYKLEAFEKTAIIEKINFYKTKKKSLKFSPIFQIRDKKKVFFLDEKENSYFVNIDKDYVLFSLDTDEWIKISTVYDYKEKYDHVPWEKLSCFASSAEMTS